MAVTTSASCLDSAQLSATKSGMTNAVPVYWSESGLTIIKIVVEIFTRYLYLCMLSELTITNMLLITMARADTTGCSMPETASPIPTKL